MPPDGNTHLRVDFGIAPEDTTHPVNLTIEGVVFTDWNQNGVRDEGEHFSSGGNIKGFLEASPETVSNLAWNIGAPARCSKPVIAANRGYCFGVGF